MSDTLWRANAARFFSKVSVGAEAECWDWKGKISAHHGTGIFAFRVGNKAKPRAPHLVSWELYNGPLPGNLRVESRCKNMHCCNPDHLYTAAKQGRVRRCSTKTLTDITQETFWRNVKKGAPNECWLWQGATSKFGYGIISYSRRGKKISEGAHRYHYFLTHPETDEKVFVCHHCDVPACVNLAHLYAGDAASNNRDRAVRGRNAARQSYVPKNAKLTPEIVREILRLHASGKLNQTLVAKQYGVSQSAINMVVKRINWRHINP